MQFILDEKLMIVIVAVFVIMAVLLFVIYRGQKTYENLIYNEGEFRMLITSEHKQEVAAGKLHFSRSSYRFSLEEKDEMIYLVLSDLEGEYSLDKIYELFEEIMT